MEELTHFLGVCSKSVILYIQELTNIFEQFDGKITFKNDTNNFFCLEKNEGFPIYNVYLHYYKESYNYQIIDFMYKHPDKDLEDFLEIYCTSLSTVLRYANLLMNYFKQHKLVFRKASLALEGEETTIRCFYYYFFWESTRHGGWPFVTEKFKIDQYLFFFEETYQITLNGLRKKIFAYWLTIILERSKVYPIVISDEIRHIAQMDSRYSLVKRWIDKTELQLSEEEQCFIYTIIYAYGILEGQAEFEQCHIQAHALTDSKCYRLAECLTKAIQELFSVPINFHDENQIFGILTFYQRSELFFGNTDVLFHHSFPDQIKDKNLGSYQKIKELHKMLLKISDRETSSILENWNQLFVNYYYILDYYGLLTKNFPPLKILLLNDRDPINCVWLKHKIEAFFGNVYSLVCYNHLKEITDADLVISNYHVETGDKPLLLMKSIPTHRNWQDLEKLLYQLQVERAFKSPSADCYCSFCE